MMILRPILGTITRPNLNTFVRNLRPTIRINKDRFQISIDVRQFTKEEIRVKARPEYVIVEGKQEREMKNGYYQRQFVRKFKLPTGCHPDRIQSRISQNGILTIIAHRQSRNFNVPCETSVPISYAGPEDDEISFVNVQDKSKDCGNVNVPISKEEPKKREDNKDVKKP